MGQNLYPTTDTHDVSALACLAVVILAGLLRSRHEPESEFLSAQRWHYRDFVICWAVFTLILLLPDSGMSRLTRLPVLAIDTLSASVIVVSVWGVIRSRQRHPWRAVGITLRAVHHDGLWALSMSLGVAFILTIVALAVRLATVGNKAPGPFVWRGRVGEFVAAVAISVVVFPLAEELLFRGLAYAPLYRRCGPVGASIGSAVLWAAAHIGSPAHSGLVAVSVTIVLGIVYAEVYRRKESLVPPLIFHVVGNGVGIVIIDPYPVTLLLLSIAVLGLWAATMLRLRSIKRSDERT